MKTTITITFGEKSFDLTVEEARRLQKLLNEMFGPEQVITSSPRADALDELMKAIKRDPYPDRPKPLTPLPDAPTHIVRFPLRSAVEEDVICYYANEVPDRWN